MDGETLLELVDATDLETREVLLLLSRVYRNLEAEAREAAAKG
jgi:hypothetical protein